jgi:predicted  nucleic acid-binding Zn-ribbon protein
MPEPTLEFIGQQQAKILAELADARTERANERADMAVLLAIVQRLDASVQGLTNEVRAMHGQIGRFANRLQRIEERVFAQGV